MPETTLTAKLAVRTANWILRTFAPQYAKFIGGSIEYGMRAAAVDSEQGNPTPPDWRIVTDARGKQPSDYAFLEADYAANHFAFPTNAVDGEVFTSCDGAGWEFSTGGDAPVWELMSYPPEENAHG